MDSPITIKDIPAQHVLGVRFKTSMAGIGRDIGQGYGEVFGYLQKIGVPPSGPPTALYYDVEVEGDTIDMEVCVPVAGETSGKGEVLGYVLRGGKAATIMYKGAYNEVGSAYEALFAYIKENGMALAGPTREIYLTDPAQVEDPADNLTEIVFLVE